MYGRSSGGPTNEDFAEPAIAANSAVVHASCLRTSRACQPHGRLVAFGIMMKTSLLFAGGFLTFLCLLVSSCVPPVWVRVFNTTDHPIQMAVDSGRKLITIPSGGSDRADWCPIVRGHDQGFVIEDAGTERFYIVFRPADDGSSHLAISIPLPERSQKSRVFGREVLVEYSSDGLVYALDRSDEEVPRRLDPQPEGFPMRPNQPPLRTPGSGTPTADAPVAPPPGIAGR